MKYNINEAREIAFKAMEKQDFGVIWECMWVIHKENERLHNLVKKSDSLPPVSDSHFTEFCCFVTGHDEDTISQMYQDWKRYR